MCGGDLNQFRSKVEAAVDVGGPTKKKKQNRRKPQSEGEGDEE